jgi:hypothetical protein
MVDALSAGVGQTRTFFSKILVPILEQVPGVVPVPKLEPDSSSGSKNSSKIRCNFGSVFCNQNQTGGSNWLNRVNHPTPVMTSV